MSSMMAFRNTANGYVEKIRAPFLFTLLFGCFYFAVRGVWTHAIASFFLAMMTAGISWLLYPFFASQIMRTHYLRRGWIEVWPPAAQGRALDAQTLLILAVLIVAGAIGLGVLDILSSDQE